MHGEMQWDYFIDNNGIFFIGFWQIFSKRNIIIVWYIYFFVPSFKNGINVLLMNNYLPIITREGEFQWTRTSFLKNFFWRRSANFGFFMLANIKRENYHQLSSLFDWSVFEHTHHQLSSLFWGSKFIEKPVSPCYGSNHIFLITRLFLQSLPLSLSS